MVIEKQATWLDDYKKEVKTLMGELDNLDQKQLRALSLKLKNNFKKVIEDSDYKIPDDYFGVAKSILLEDKNIKDEYKDEFWGFVLSRTLAGKSGGKMHYAIHIPDDDWKSWHVNQSEMEYDNFNDFIYSWDSMDLFYKFDDDYKSELLGSTFRSFCKRNRILFNLKSKTLAALYQIGNVDRLTNGYHLVAAFQENKHDVSILAPIKPVYFPLDLKILLFKAFCHEWADTPDSRKYWDDFVLADRFSEYLKKYSENNISGILDTNDIDTLISQIDHGRIPNIKGLTLTELKKISDRQRRLNC
mgnify:CR=1 FL=1